jgi:TPR repeat protein
MNPLHTRLLTLAGMILFAAAPVYGAGNPDPAAYERGDHARAAREFELGAARGERLAQFNLAMMIFRGEAAGSRGAAIDWLRKAADQRLPQAQYNLGLLYENGAGLPRSQADATAWFRRAAEQGHTDAQVSLATQYMLGRGAPKSLAEAARWYLQAAEGDDAAAQYIIASFYEHGDGVKQDLGRALFWYAQAARQVDALARGKAKELAERIGSD